VEGVGFSFYTKEQIMGLSVKRVAVQPAFDQQGVPVSDGLYDPAFGPLGMHGVCVTCGLTAKHCPGHCGHIELPVPIINPLLFGACYKILQKTCHWCYNFRIRGGQGELEFLMKQFQLLDEGRVTEASDLGKNAEEELHAAAAENAGPPKKATDVATDASPSLLVATKRAEAVAYLTARLTDGKCTFCGAFSPKLRSYQKSKVLVDPLPAKVAAKNHDLGIELKSSIFKQPELQDEEEELKSEEEYVPKKGPLADGDDENDSELSSSAPDKEEDLDERLVPAVDEVDEDAPEPAAVTEATSAAVAGRRWMTPLEVQEHLRRVWNRCPRLCGMLWNHLIAAEDGRFQRIATSYEVFMMNVLLVPPSRFRPPQISAATGRLAEHGHHSHLNKVLSTINAFVSESKIKDKKEASAARGRLWHSLQVAVAEFFDSSGNAKAKDYHGGIKQILDKKEGLFRRNMMGKRVNYAARTVISPDPYIETDEIGIPMVFAKKLTFPTPVTWHNYEQLARAVVNGPDAHPGATQVEKDGFVKNLKNMSKEGRVALSKTLLEHAPLQPGSTAVVHAHVQSGDFVLLNRQPSLHKPSMMGMKVRVLGEERTMRMHYANCSSFNADFDGDEMNIHLPQSLNAKADIRFAAMSRDQYLSPKDGGPLRGLIQDHVLSGVLLTMKDTFFSRSDYQLLVYSAIYAVRPLLDITTEPPAIFKPKPLWTGKQVISTIVKHVLAGKPFFNFTGQARIKGSMWGPEGAEEGTVQFAGGDLVTGVIDKSQSGASANGFVHACYTLYGGDVAERLLTSMGRVFTKFLQMYGFTCGMEDFLLSPKVEEERRRVLALAKERSTAAVKEFVESDQVEDEALERALHERLVKVPTEETRLDGAMKKVSHKLTDTVVDLAIPTGMRKPFPHNNFFLMVTAGAKGSTVNFSMIACCLGQMELEGKRVARMASGRTLPGFRPYETNVVAGGFISQRFLTGVRPREFYHHCMAGREGLIDTAVKTSRSGYLQRCIIKHLESLVVSYDGTVRDSDGSVVQFAYGEDGLDPVHHASVHNLKLWSENKLVAAMRLPLLEKQLAEAVQLYHSRFLSKSLRLPDFAGHRFTPRSDEIRAGSLLETHSPFELGVVSDKFLERMRDAKVQDPKLAKLMMFNYLRLLVPPGESVGVLAGQSIGEPSTQMTLVRKLSSFSFRF
jgi:DNA-directed RNA polymerase I subunit RPA1